MVRVTLVLSAALVLLAISCGAAASSFDEPNPIRLVSDGLRELEQQVVQVLGNSRSTLHFARFAHRYGKKYESVEEMKLRYEIFSENKKLIRSTNKKGLPYTLAVNRFADWSWEEFRRQRLGAAQDCSVTTKGSHKLNAQLKTKVTVDLAGHSALLVLLRQLMCRHSESKSLYLSSSLWIVPELSITLAAMVGCHLKLLSTSNTMAVSTPRLHILTLDPTGLANFQLKMLVSKCSTLSISPWVMNKN